MTDKNTEYRNILNRLKKPFSIFEGIFLVRKQTLTNNSFFYFICIFIRFIYIISLSGDFNNIVRRNVNRNVNFKIRLYTIQSFLKKLNCFNIMNQFNISFNFYKIAILVILIIFIIKLLLDLIMYQQFKKYPLTNKWPMPNKIQIILTHINLILFPYLIEFFSFSYYMILFRGTFFIEAQSSENVMLLIIIVVNVILTIIFNIDNYINISCSNKIYITNHFDAYINVSNEKSESNNKSIAFRYSNLITYIFIFLQNLSLISTIENYLTRTYPILFKIIVSIFILLSIIIIFADRLNNFNYSNFINKFISVLFLFCFYSILFDVIMYFYGYRLRNIIKEVIYILIRLLLSYISYVLLIYKTNFFLEKKVSEILFKEKIDKKNKYFINSFFYLHNLMIKIKEKQDINTAFSLVKFLNKHINHCNNLTCNCKLFEIFIKENNEKLNKEEIKNFIFELIIILNYLFEFVFIEYDFYSNYDLTILLSEHFCHLKNNPIMAFSIISTFILKKSNKLNLFQRLDLYELSQKYIYFMSAKSKNNLEKEVKDNKSILLLYKNKVNIFKEYYFNLNFSIKMKKIINNYIDVEMKILKYKNIFADSLTFQFDENNENIISCKLNFFNHNTKIDNFENNFGNKKMVKKRGKMKQNKTNLYNILYLLKEEYNSYRNIINSINKIDIKREMPIFIIFKYFLFFDLYWGGKVSEQISNKLYAILNKNRDNNKNEYLILKKKFNEENNKIDSKAYLLVEFKKDLRTKYFTESGALKLGYQQKDIINEKIDILMPSSFCKSHQNTIKQLLIGNQLRYNMSKQSFFFNANSTILYSVNLESALIYNITKSLINILEITFNLENEYRFMLDSNFELLAHSKNFEDEYFLNQRIIQSYNIKLLDIIKLKPEKLNKKFEKEIKKISFQKILKQLKTEEYLIPKLYLQTSDKGIKLVSHNLNSSIKNILSKISNLIKREENFDENKDNHEIIEDEEEKHLINKENIKNSLYELFINPREIVFHKTYNSVLNRGKFTENIAKELTKIPENDLIFENDKVSYNLVKASKKLISNLLTKDELLNQSMIVKIIFSFYYDKPFYFISIDDEKKLYLKISKTINFENSHKIINENKRNNNVPFIRNDSKSRNPKLKLNKKISIEGKNKNDIKGKYFNKNEIHEIENIEKLRVLDIINDYRKRINKDKFILIIKWILSIIIIIIMSIIIILILFQNNLISVLNLLLKAYYYNNNNKCLILGIQSSALQIYFDSCIFAPKSYNNDLVNHYIFTNLTQDLKISYHYFTEYFFLANLKLGKNFDLIYDKKNFTKLRGFWKNIVYESTFASEMDFMIFNIFNLNVGVKTSKASKDDFAKFLFFRERSETKEKIFSPFIKVLYYLTNNVEFAFRDIFSGIESLIYKTSKDYVNKNLILYYFLELLSLLLYVIFFSIAIIFLVSSNNIIFKNIIFLFLDFSDNNYDKNKINIDNNIITFKLLEFRNIMDDLDINRFEKYSININNINLNKFNKGLNTLHTLGTNQKDKITSEISNTSNNESKNKFTLKKKEIHKHHNNPNQVNGSNGDGKIFLDIKNRALNNSSHNYLADSVSNSKLFKDSNNNSINASNEFLASNNTKIYSTKNGMNSMYNKYSSKKDDYENKDNYQDIILNKSNKNIILKIRIFVLIILLLIIIVVGLISFKLEFFLTFLKNYIKFCTDLTVLTNRYMLLYKYFNDMRTLIIFPDNEKKVFFQLMMEAFDQFYVEENNKYLNILAKDMDNYAQTKQIFTFVKESKNNSTEKIKEELCQENNYCITYLNSKDNIFDSGVDFAFQTSIKETTNILLEYKKLDNDQKFNINIINETLIYTQNSKFVDISLALQYMFVSVENKIIKGFDADEISFRKRIVNSVLYLNIVFIIYNIFSFIYVVLFVFPTISNFISPIKDSTYRICCSFYYIKKYNLNYYKKLDSILKF